MEPIQIIRDYLIDNDKGMKILLTWFPNPVMQMEALEQAGAETLRENRNSPLTSVSAEISPN
jgi:hypothetical protein